jgi:hypothetical protein
MQREKAKRERASFLNAQAVKAASSMSSDEDVPAPSPSASVTRGGASCEPRSEVDARGVQQR